MMTHNSIQSKVGPSTRRASLFPNAAPKTMPNPVPKPAAPKKKPHTQLPKYYDPRDRLPEDAIQGSYIQRRRPELFLLVVGLICIGLGIGLTWYGDYSNLRDFLVIGPGCLVIGTGMMAIALVMICQDIRRKRKQTKVTIDTVQRDAQQDHDETRSTIPDYLLPVGLPISDDLGITKEPSALDLYGENNHKKAKQSTDTGTTEPPNLAKPVYNDQGDEETKVEVYHVPLPAVAEVTQTKQLHEDRLDQSESKAKSVRVSSASSSVTLDSRLNPYALGDSSDEAELMRELTDMELYGERCSTTITVLTDAEAPTAVQPTVHTPVPGAVQ